MQSKKEHLKAMQFVTYNHRLLGNVRERAAASRFYFNTSQDIQAAAGITQPKKRGEVK